jgi:hypothetical protein
MQIILTYGPKCLTTAILIGILYLIVSAIKDRKKERNGKDQETEGNKTTAEASEFEIYKQAADIEKHLKKDKQP